MERRFKHYTNKQLIKRINKRFSAGLNDDDEVYELFKRKEEQGFEVIVGLRTYQIKGQEVM